SASTAASPEVRTVASVTRLLDQTSAHRARNRRSPVRDPKLLVQVLDVSLDRRQPEVELLRNVGETLPFRDQVKNLLFAFGECGGVVLLAQSNLCNKTGCDIGRHDILASRARENRIDDLLPARLLRYETRSAGLERLVDDAAVGKRRDEQNASRQLLADHGMRNGDAVELGELVVEHGDVGDVAQNLGQRRAAVLRLGDDVDLSACREGPNNPLPVERVVVRDDNTNARLC